MQTHQINWRSFRNYLLEERREIAARWNVSSWPTVLLIDSQGEIRHIYRGTPPEKDLDAAIESLVAAAKP